MGGWYHWSNPVMETGFTVMKILNSKKTLLIINHNRIGIILYYISAVLWQDLRSVC